jgi:hypothetical protein
MSDLKTHSSSKRNINFDFSCVVYGRKSPYVFTHAEDLFNEYLINFYFSLFVYGRKSHYIFIMGNKVFVGYDFLIFSFKWIRLRTLTRVLKDASVSSRIQLYFETC